MSSPGVAGVIGAGLPVLLLWLKLGVAFSRMAKRKGMNTRLALIGAFPAWALFFGLWLMIRSDDHPAASEDEPLDEVQS